MQPIRPIVHSLTDLPAEPEELTLRQLVEWSKRIVREGPEVPTGSERKQIDATFFRAAKAIADREGGPVGYISGTRPDPDRDAAPDRGRRPKP